MELDKDFYSLKEVGEIFVQLGIITRKGANGYHTVHKLVQKGEIESEMPGVRSQGRRISKESLETYLKEHAPKHISLGGKSKRENELELEVESLKAQLKELQGDNVDSKDDLNEILFNMPRDTKDKIYKHFEGLYGERFKEEVESRRHWYGKYQEAISEVSVLREQIKTLEKGVRPLTNKDFYPPEQEEDVLHINVFGERKIVTEFYDDLTMVKGYFVSYLEEGYRNKKREQKYAKLLVHNKKKKVIHIPKNDDWITKYWKIEVMDIKDEKSYANPTEKNYVIHFKYKGIGLEYMTFTYHFTWSNWEGLKREERISWQINEEKAEMSKQTEIAFNNRFKFGDEKILNKIRGILERKLEEIEDYKMLVPFIFVD